MMRFQFRYPWEKKAAGSELAGRLPLPGKSGSGSGAGWSGDSSFFVLNWTRPSEKRIRDAAGVKTKNSAVAAVLQTISTCWPQAVPVVKRRGKKGAEEIIADHPLTALLLRPAPWHTGRAFMQALLRDWYGEGKGNAYAFIVLANDGTPVELQYLPARCMKPKAKGSELVAFFDYQPDGARKPIPLPANRVIHWKNGIDPSDAALGCDPLESVTPEIATDNEAVRWQFGLLNRGGVPAWIMTPDGTADGGSLSIDTDTADEIKERMQETVNGEERGSGSVLTGPMEFQTVGIEPKKMVMGETQRKGEERIAGVVGIPPVVAGLGAGLDRATFANYTEARAQAWEDTIVPLQDSFAEEINAKIWEFYANSEGLYLDWDRTNVPCLQGDRTAKEKNAALLFEKGVVDRATAKRRAGETADKSDEGVYAGMSALPVAGTKGEPPFPFVLPQPWGEKTEEEQ